MSKISPESREGRSTIEYKANQTLWGAALSPGKAAPLPLPKGQTRTKRSSSLRGTAYPAFPTDILTV